MNKNDKRLLLFTSFICLFPIVIGLYFYEQLPEKIPIHFNINNQPDSYFIKPLFVFGIPILMMVLQTIVCLRSSKYDPYEQANRKMTLVMRWIIPILTFVMYLLTIYYTLAHPLDIRLVVMVVVGILLIIVGNYLPKTKRVSYLHFGFMKQMDDRSYRKISRFSGYMLVINGFLFLISIMFDKMVSVFLVVLLMVESLLLTVYSIKKGVHTHEK